MTLRERVWEAYQTPRMYVGPETPRRAVERFGSVVVTDLGVDQPWGMQMCSGLQVPTTQDYDAARDWCESRGSLTWRARVPVGLAQSGPWLGLQRFDTIGVFATRVGSVPEFDSATPPELRLSFDPSYDDVVTAYGGWMAAPDLARDLVHPNDITLPWRRFVVGYVDEQPIGCAFVWFVCGTAYLSGIGVVEQLRGRGYGRALTIAATMTALEPPSGESVDCLWMGATDAGAALYAQLGYTRIDTEVQLGLR